jgi:hypothetical protein
MKNTKEGESVPVFVVIVHTLALRPLLLLLLATGCWCL